MEIELLDETYSNPVYTSLYGMSSTKDHRPIALSKGLTTIRRPFCFGSVRVHYLGAKPIIIGVLDLSMTVI